MLPAQHYTWPPLGGSPMIIPLQPNVYGSQPANQPTHRQQPLVGHKENKYFGWNIYNKQTMYLLYAISKINTIHTRMKLILSVFYRFIHHIVTSLFSHLPIGTKWWDIKHVLSYLINLSMHCKKNSMYCSVLNYKELYTADAIIFSNHPAWEISPGVSSTFLTAQVLSCQHLLYGKPEPVLTESGMEI